MSLFDFSENVYEAGESSYSSEGIFALLGILAGWGLSELSIRARHKRAVKRDGKSFEIQLESIKPFLDEQIKNHENEVHALSKGDVYDGTDWFYNGALDFVMGLDKHLVIEYSNWKAKKSKEKLETVQKRIIAQYRILNILSKLSDRYQEELTKSMLNEEKQHFEFIATADALIKAVYSEELEDSLGFRDEYIFEIRLEINKHLKPGKGHQNINNLTLDELLFYPLLRINDQNINHSFQIKCTELVSACITCNKKTRILRSKTAENIRSDLKTLKFVRTALFGTN